MGAHVHIHSIRLEVIRGKEKEQVTMIAWIYPFMTITEVIDVHLQTPGC